jgi:CubicO group peptidase (beta-lactamase class C family)
MKAIYHLRISFCFRSKVLLIFACALLACLALSGCDNDSNEPTYNSTIKKSSQAIERIMQENDIPGCTVVLVDGQRVVWAQGFGYANKENNIPVTTETVMPIGSVSKMLTTLMNLQMVDANNLDLDRPVSDYLHEFSMQSRFQNQSQGWTTRNLLSHHAGIPGDIYNKSFVTEKYWDGYPTWLINYLQSDYPLYPPETIARYCNSGFVIAGELIARHDGLDFTECAENRLFIPLGMTHSSFLPDTKRTVAENMATGYSNGDPAPLTIANLSATGGAYSRPLDMAILIKMMLAHGMAGSSRFVTQSSLEQMMTFTGGPMDVDNFFKPGLGLDCVDDPVMNYAGKAIFKNGSTGIFEALIEILPDQQLGAFVNINCANEMTFAIVHEILANAVEEKTGLKRPATPAMPDSPQTEWTAAQLQSVAGHYITGSGIDLVTAESDGSLSITRNYNSSPQLLKNFRPHENGRFWVPGNNTRQLEFATLDNQEVIISYGSTGSVRDEIMYGGYAETLYGTRYRPAAISQKWQDRCDTLWVANNLIYNDFFMDTGELIGWYLDCTNNMLTATGIGFAVLEPQNDTTAFAKGFSSRGDGGLRMIADSQGREHLIFGGYNCTRIEDIEQLVRNQSKPVTLDPQNNSLFVFNATRAEQKIKAELGSEGWEGVISIFDLDSFTLAARGTQSVTWTAERSGQPFLITISSPESARTDMTIR